MANSYPRPIKLRGMTAKVESAYGTDPTPSASTDAVRIRGPLRPNPEFAFPNFRDDVVHGSIIGEAPPGEPAGLMVQFDVDCELTGSGAAYSASVLPQIHPLLIASGMGHTVDATGGAEKVTYTFADTGHGSCTIWAYTEDGKLIKINGVRTTWSIPITAGQLGVIRFTVYGLINVPASGLTEADLASLTYDSVKPPPMKATGLIIVNSTDTWDGPRSPSATINGGVDIQQLDDASDAVGAIEQFAINEIKPTFEMNARAVALADYDYVAAKSSVLSHTIDLTIGSAQYNRVDLDVNEAYLESYPERGEDKGFASGRFMYRCNDLSLVFD